LKREFFEIEQLLMPPIKLALIGCGRVSKRHIEAVEAVECIDIAVVCDIDENILFLTYC